MGTRADFYVGRGADAEWIGSIALDGYPHSIYAGRNCPGDLTDYPILAASTDVEYRMRVEEMFAQRNDVTRPAKGWPWPWDDSRTTDYAYAFDGGKVWASCFGGAWFDPQQEQPDEEGDEKVAVFPRLGGNGHSAPAGSPASGIIMFGVC